MPGDIFYAWKGGQENNNTTLVSLKRLDGFMLQLNPF